IVDMVSRIALSYGDVKISLTSGSSKVFSTRGNGNILNNIISIYGSETSKDLIPVESSMSGFVLKGFVSSPASSAPSRNKQIFCVNGRIISSSVLEKALDEAYKEKLFHGRFPIAFLFLAMPPEKLDVNVHPTKKEVRFDDDHEVLDFVAKAVREALMAKDAVPQIREEGLKSLKAEQKPEEKVIGKLYEKPDQGIQYDFSTIKREKNIISVSEEHQNILNEDSKEQTVEIKSFDDTVNIKNILTTLRRESHEDGDIKIQAPDRRPFDFDDLRTIGTIFNTYILAADEDSFYLIDQHAAHERVFYERLLEQYNTEEKNRQTLLMPLNFNVSAQVASTEDIWLDKVSSMGYDIEFFGNNTYLVREIPAFMDLDEAETFLSDMFKELEDKPDLTNKKTLEKIITRSCKSAVKGGDRLDINEIDSLMKDLRSCINPFSCPHGRPTFIRMTKYEIEKMFKRV
ncbi:MAG: hypothetical protein IJA50_03190, partial [Firmicutes bacterium]|nr:hypothetical protein [Bacillota bacterium]